MTSTKTRGTRTRVVQRGNAKQGTTHIVLKVPKIMPTAQAGNAGRAPASSVEQRRFKAAAEKNEKRVTAPTAKLPPTRPPGQSHPAFFVSAAAARENERSLMQNGWQSAGRAAGIRRANRSRYGKD